MIHNQNIRILKIAAAVAFLGSGTLVSAQSSAERSAPSMGGPFQALAGEGGEVHFKTGPHPNGGPASINLTTAPDGSFQNFRAVGSLDLDSPKFHITALQLDYDAGNGVLEAREDVTIEQDAITATCQHLVYNPDLGEIVLTGNPVVVQETPTMSSRFEGMEIFTIIQQEGGGADIQMEGGEQIVATMKSSATAEATPPANGNATSGTGISSLGDNVKISVRERGEDEPNIFTQTAESGALGIFRATGSVQLQSDAFDLRADQLEYNNTKNFMEALYNVYLKQNNIEADCGRMVYDLAKDVITLSVDPRVRQEAPGGVTNITNMDAFIIERNPDGSSDTEIVGGPLGNPQIEYISRAPEEEKPAEEPTGDPGEIRLDDPNIPTSSSP